MAQFGYYFSLGKSVILNIYSVQHILFIVALCAVYLIRDWRKVLILVLSFALGHSITLALSAYKIFSVRQELVEYFIPVTILITAIGNIMKKQSSYYKKSFQSNYILAFSFGLVHGLGFANYLQQHISQRRPMIGSLLGFNLGIEFGHIIIVMSFLIIAYIFVNLININRRDWNLVISSGIAGVAITIMFESRYWV
jgi:hypothetical protein